MSMQSVAIRARTAAHSETGWGVAAAILCCALFVAAPGKMVNGLLLGSMIALGAIGITLIYSILRFAHIAHGDYMTLGAYVTLFLLSVGLPALGIDGAGLWTVHLRLPAAHSAAHNGCSLLRYRGRYRQLGL